MEKSQEPELMELTRELLDAKKEKKGYNKDVNGRIKIIDEMIKKLVKVKEGV